MLQDRLREARERKGMSARELSEAAGLSHGYVGLIESGAKKRISGDTAVKLSAALNIPVHWLLTGEEERASGPTLPDSDDLKTG